MKRLSNASYLAVIISFILLALSGPQGAFAQRGGERNKGDERTRERETRVERSQNARKSRKPNVRNERTRRGEPGRIRVERSRKAHHRPVRRHYTKVHVSWPVFVHVDARWSRSRGYRNERLAVNVDYRHRVVYSDAHMTVVRIELDDIAFHDRGRYVGAVRRIPRDMRTIEATVYRNGDVEFDRDIYVTGDRRRGYRLVVDDGYGFRIGYVDLRRSRVSKVYHSDIAPRLGRRISLLPDDVDWMY